VALFVLSCRGNPPALPEHRYTVAAEIIRVSAPDSPRREVVLQHEAVPEFVDIDGKKVGMEAMTMPFPVAPGVDLSAFQASDAVRATFVVRFHGSPAYEVIQLEKNPSPP
jgi:Cu/Ag efflux protein CusF